MMRASGRQADAKVLWLVRKAELGFGGTGREMSVRVRASAASGSLTEQMASSTRKRGMR